MEMADLKLEEVAELYSKRGFAISGSGGTADKAVYIIRDGLKEKTWRGENGFPCVYAHEAWRCMKACARHRMHGVIG